MKKVYMKGKSRQALDCTKSTEKKFKGPNRNNSMSHTITNNENYMGIREQNFKLHSNRQEQYNCLNEPEITVKDCADGT